MTVRRANTWKNARMKVKIEISNVSLGFLVVDTEDIQSCKVEGSLESCRDNIDEILIEKSGDIKWTYDEQIIRDIREI